MRLAFQSETLGHAFLNMDSHCRQFAVEFLNLVPRFDLLNSSFIFELVRNVLILNNSSHIRHTLRSIPQYGDFCPSPQKGSFQQYAPLMARNIFV